MSLNCPKMHPFRHVNRLCHCFFQILRHFSCRYTKGESENFANESVKVDVETKILSCMRHALKCLERIPNQLQTL